MRARNESSTITTMRYCFYSIKFVYEIPFGVHGMDVGIGAVQSS